FSATSASCTALRLIILARCRSASLASGFLIVSFMTLPSPHLSGQVAGPPPSEPRGRRAPPCADSAGPANRESGGRADDPARCRGRPRWRPARRAPPPLAALF